MGQKLHQVKPETPAKRLDAYLAEHFPDLFSRSQAKRLIEEGKILLDGRQVSAHYQMKGGEEIKIETSERPPDGTRAENIPVEVIYEDSEILLISKPPGMVVHPAHGNPHHTLVNALLYHVNKLSEVGGEIRPGIVHRLDKDTSGIMIIAKNDLAHEKIASQFKDQTIQRFYRVVVRGVVQHNEGMCEEAVGRAFLNRKKVIVKPSGGKEAATYYKVIKRFAKATLLDVRPQTGRTHQIRVHMRHIGHPVLGDAFYGVTTPWIGRQAVHAFGLGFVHPKSGKEMYFESPIPADMANLISHLEAELP